MEEWVQRLSVVNEELTAGAIRDTFHSFELQLQRTFPHSDLEPRYRIIALLLRLARAHSSRQVTDTSDPEANEPLRTSVQEAKVARSTSEAARLQDDSEEEEEYDDGWDEEYNRSTSESEIEDDSPREATAGLQSAPLERRMAQRWEKLHEREEPLSGTSSTESSFLRALDAVWREVTEVDEGMRKSGDDWTGQHKRSTARRPTLQEQLQAEARRSVLHSFP
jgi:hypothetical protein